MAPQYFEKDEELNKILTRMWSLNNRLANGEPLTRSDKAFYNKNLTIIQTYYTLYGKYWRARKPL